MNNSDLWDATAQSINVNAEIDLGQSKPYSS